MTGRWRQCSPLLALLVAKVSPLTPRISWSGRGKERCFTVRDCFGLLEENYQVAAPRKMLLNKIVPYKISFFAWEMWWGKVLTINQLRKRGFQLASRCPFCQKDEEKLNHTLIHCPSIWGQWTIVLSIAGVPWVCPLSVRELINSWSCLSARKNAKTLWRAAPSSLLWVIWKERNRIVFEDTSFPAYRIQTSFYLFSFCFGWLFQGCGLFFC